MAICRTLCRSWFTLSITVMLSVLVILRKDLEAVQKRLEIVKMTQIFDSKAFYHFIEKEDVKSILSQRGNYMIHPKVFSAEIKASTYDVTIATHCSYYNLRFLPKFVKSWKGPVSVSVFSSNPTKVWLLIKLLRECSLSIRNLVDFHIIVPFFGLKYSKINSFTELEPNFLTLLERLNEKFSQNMICYNLDSLLKSLQNIEENYALNDFLEYPNNMLRNVAWENSRTNYVANIDIDLLTSRSAHELLQPFLRITWRKNRKITYIVPVFEVELSYYTQNSKKFPITKTDVMRLQRKNFMQPFYHNVCPNCQGCIQHGDWLAYREDEQELGVVPYPADLSPPCEPFLIVPRNAPKFDERFSQYGYNRMSHVCEMLSADYKFKILDNAFLTHIGYKYQQHFHGSKQQELVENEALFQTFNQELREKYSKSEKFCI